METARERADQEQYLTFVVAGDELAVAVLRVREIIEYETVTHVPSTPAWIRGVINLRGSVVPVVDLGLKFGLAGSPVTRRTCIVMVDVDLDGQRTTMGVVADAVNQVIELGPGDIEAPPSFGTRVRVDYLRGMGKRDGRFVLILDIDGVLSARELLLASEAGVAAGQEAAP
jgi:purine-binding chemotaxis protein CheW